MRANPLVLVAAAGLLTLGCEELTNPFSPAVLEVRLIQDTNDTAGGYQVQALVRDATGILSSDILFTGAPPGLPATEGRARMSRVDQLPERDGDRYQGTISGYPIGTTVRYAVRACNRLGICATDPVGWPDREAYAFVVGTLPSDPHVIFVNPPRGPTAGGLRVRVTGQDFRPGMKLTFDGNPCSYAEILSTTEALCIIPAGNIGVVDVTAINPDGMKGTLREGFTYYPTPRPIRVIPDRGPTRGGTAVIVEGEFFLPGARVKFEGRYARRVEVLSESVIHCETPPGNPGLVDVAVEHPEGGEGVLEDGYRYVPPPIIDGVIPPEGPDFGGQEVTIVGENFEEGATVTLDGELCTELEFISSTQLRCTVPPGTPGAADVTVTNPDDQEGTLPGGYYYNGPPVVIGVDPPEGPIAAGAEVDVLGAGFLPGMTVSIGDQQAVVVGNVSRDRVHVVVPGVPPADVVPTPPTGTRAADVSVTNPAPDGRTAVLVEGYTYVWPPLVERVVPDRGPTAGGTMVTVFGRFFRPILGSPILVRFDDGDAQNIQVISTTEIRAVTPPGDPGLADVVVQNHPLSLGVGVSLYTYVPPPRVDSVTPPDGPTFGGDLVTIRGEFFQPGATVTFDGAPCSGPLVSMDGMSITCTVPAGERGPADVVVTNPDGQSGTLLRGYTYLPLVVRPGGGLEAGFTRVRIQGAGMREGVRIFFGGTPATDVQRISEREVVVQSPPRPLGTVDVSFRNPDGTNETAEDAFTYRTFKHREGAVPTEFAIGNDADLADVDGDGDMDVMVANGGVDEPQESVLLINEGGTFSQRRFVASLVANQASFGDVTGDGTPDLLIAASSESHLYINNGGGNFTETPMVDDGDGAFEGVIADFNSDGVNDIFLLNIGCSEGNDPNCDANVRGRDTLLINAGGGAFDNQSDLIPHDRALIHDHKVEITDLDGDGRNDIIIVVDNKNFEGPAGAGRNRHRILLNRSTGYEEVAPPDFVNTVGDIYGIAIGDLNGDGRQDMVLPNFLPSNFGQLGFPGSPGSTAILLGGQGATFIRDDSGLGVGPLDEFTINTNLCDLDDDGDLEIISVNLGGLSRVFVNKGAGQFAPADAALPFDDLQSVDIVCADFDLDGDQDLYMVNQGEDRLLVAGTER